MKRKKRKRTHSFLRWLFSASLLVLFYLLSEKSSIGSIEEGNPPAFFSNQCNDNLEMTFIKAIEDAEHSIYLVMYSLTDKKIVDALNKRAQEGVKVTIIHDKTTSEEQFVKKIHAEEAHISGLMHQKILVIDNKNVWIGSANFTRESLKLHDNLVVGVTSPNLAERIIKKTEQHHFTIGNQLLEFWTFPEQGNEGLGRLINLLDQAKKTIRVAMFTWTHPSLTAAAKRAAARGVSVEIVMDYGQGIGVNLLALETLKKAHLNVNLSSSQMLHHKFVWIDDTILALGSANWTKAAFFRNQDCLLVIHDLNETQQEKLKKIWRQTSCKIRNHSINVANIWFFLPKMLQSAA